MDPEQAARLIVDNAERQWRRRRGEGPRSDMLDDVVQSVLDVATERDRTASFADGAEAAHTLWREWFDGYLTAQAQNTPYLPASPDQVRYAALKPVTHYDRCAKRRRTTRAWHPDIAPDYACTAQTSDYYRGEDPIDGQLCPGCNSRELPCKPYRGRRATCRCGLNIVCLANLMLYWYDLRHYAKLPEPDGTALCTRFEQPANRKSRETIRNDAKSGIDRHDSGADDHGHRGMRSASGP